MNKWENSFEKVTSDITNNKCKCSSLQGLFIPNRQLSIVVAGLLFLLFSIFITGYFLGKKYCVEQFTKEMHIDTFEDIVVSAPNEASSAESEITSPSLLVTATDNNNSEQLDVNSLIVPQSVATINQDIVLPSQDEPKRYYAQLIGFGTEKAASQFVNKVSLNGIPTEVKKRVSKTAKGRTSYWYQVVTAPYLDKNDLSRIVDKLVKEEKLRDVCIRVC
jgi:hypothetical protein